MKQFQQKFIFAVKAFEKKFKTKPDILQGHSRTLILSLVNNLSDLLKSFNIKINFNDALPPGEIYVGKFTADKFQSIQIERLPAKPSAVDKQTDR